MVLAMPRHRRLSDSRSTSAINPHVRLRKDRWRALRGREGREGRRQGREGRARWQGLSLVQLVLPHPSCSCGTDLPGGLLDEGDVGRHHGPALEDDEGGAQLVEAVAVVVLQGRRGGSKEIS